ncbi:META domain-containing protein [Dokdonia sinensis]|uniref:META domain-containing protein n=1 Tax=Dokdonia sinensis TaxID=2479847 RepID=A0A3M0GCG5_9FLAO|nr:META domain-containing protein [Dokdonia sinensis]RMB62831.1 META domain-containing protein [Dokdonia sinensis]
MKNVILSFFVLSAFALFAQEKITLEVAPYTIYCDDTESERCLQLLDTLGASLEIVGMDAIEGFKAEEGFEYTIEAQPLPVMDDGVVRYRLIKETSKMWVPQYATDAPTLNGSFQVVGFNGRSLNNNQIDLVINANNSIMRGSTGCNNYHLFFKQLGYSLIFSKILASHLLCDSRSALDEEYFVVFNSVHHFDLQGDVLRLYDITNKLLLEAQRIR